jgi:glycosyltransferase involved in cell wall biosynthesis
VRPKRALFIVHSYYLRDTRPRRHATALADAGWEVDVICARDRDEAPVEQRGRVRISRLPARRRRGSKFRYAFEYVTFALMAFGAATLAFLRRRHRVVYVVGIPNFIVFAALVPRLAGARVLLDMRDPLPEFFQAKYAMPHDAPLIRALRTEEKLSARFASRVVTVVPSMAELYARSVSPRKIDIVMNAPDPRVFTDDGRLPARDPNGRTMLYTGTVAERYGVDVAVRALARLRDEIPGLRLRIVTKNTREEGVAEVRALAAREGVGDLVSVEGPIPISQMPGVVREAWVGVQPNKSDALMEHSLSQKVLEWVQLGTPVVCGRTRALLDVFDGDELLFHAPGDVDSMCERLREAHADPGALGKRAQRAREACERIGYEAQMAKLLELFGDDGRGA